MGINHNIKKRAIAILVYAGDESLFIADRNEFRHQYQINWDKIGETGARYAIRLMKTIDGKVIYENPAYGELSSFSYSDYNKSQDKKSLLDTFS